MTLAQAAPINPLGQTSPTGFSTSYLTDWSRGWRFQVNAAGVKVSELGLAAPDAAEYTLSLFDVATTSLLASTTVNVTTPGSWQFQTLGAPVALSLGGQYLVEVSSTAGQYYYNSTIAGSVWQPTGTIQYLDMKWCNSCAAGVYPTSTLSNYMYGIPDIGYTIGASAVPEPATYAMLGAGLLGLLAFRRKR